MNILPYDAIVFDLDGTICNAEHGITSSLLYAMETLGHPIPQGLDLREVIGPPLRDSLTNLFHLSAEDADQVMCVYRNRFDEVGMYQYTVYPHMRTILRTLKNAGAYLAVASSKPKETVRGVLEYFGLAHYFDIIIGVESDQIHQDKPQLVKMALPEKYKRAAMVGDRRFDMQGASANNISGIGAGYGHGSDEELRDAGATHIVPDTEALRALLCQGLEIPNGFFLTVEGPDGSGKTTQVDLLEKSLRDFGFSVLRTREPGGCPISEDIRQIILDTDNMEMSAACEALLYAAARAQHVHQVIRPAVEKGMLVLCDRFVDSSVAYQGSGRELGMEAIQQINEPAVNGMMPDATIYLHMEFRKALQRRMCASTPDRLEMEALDFHERVQKSYEKLLHDNKKRFLPIDADQNVQDVARCVMRAALTRLEPDMKQEG